MKKTLIIIATLTLLFPFSTQATRLDIKSSLPTNVTNGLIGWYKFEGNGNDSAGTVGNLTMHNDTYVAGKIDSLALKLATSSTGSLNTYGVTPAQVWPQSGYTFSAWVNMNDITTQQAIDCRWTGAGNPYTQMYITSGVITARIMQTQSIYIGRDTPSTVLTPNAWHLVTFTWSGGTANSAVKIYVDGVEVDSADDGGGSFSHASTDSDTNTVGLLDVAGFDLPMSGLMDDARIYNRALSSSEVSTIFQYTGLSTFNTFRVLIGHRLDLER